MGKISRVTEQVFESHRAAFLEIQFFGEEGPTKEVLRAAEWKVNELRTALSDFWGSSLLLFVEEAFFYTPAQNKNALLEAASQLEKVRDEAEYREVLTKYLVLLEKAVGAKVVRYVI
jgi:hypothetical protein